MFPDYITAVMGHLSKERIVFDNFHKIMLFDDKFLDLERKVYHEVYAWWAFHINFVSIHATLDTAYTGCRGGSICWIHLMAWA